MLNLVKACAPWLNWKSAGIITLVAVGALVVVLYGIIPTFQPATLDFGRVYAAYGGAFIVLSLLWGWLVDGLRPDTPSTVGAAIALVGAAIIVYWPRV
jgi:small multidrug resistance family-3 protein